MPVRSLSEKLLRPSTIAIVGASGDLAKNNSRPQRFLRRHGFKGGLYPVNPNQDALFGERCYRSLGDIPEPADHALVMVPTAAVEGVIRQCGEAGIAVASIFAGGFSESGDDGRRLQERLVKTARAANVRLVGPNSLGILNPNASLALSASAALEKIALKPGRTAVISQSGSLIGALVSRGEPRGIGFSTLISIGNECDLSVGEIGQMLVDDPETAVIVLFLETLRNRAHVDAFAKAAAAAGKPVLAYVLGRSELGRTLATSHTGALIGEGGAFDAYITARGFARINQFESLIEAPQVFLDRKPAHGQRVAMATTTGGGAAIVADHLGERGIEVVPPTQALRASLAKLGLDVGEAPVVDLTMAGTREAVVDTVIGGFMADARIDAVIMVIGSTAQSYPELVVKPLAKWARGSKPLVTFMFPDALPSLKLVAEAGIAGFRSPEACADAVAAYLTWQPVREMDKAPLPEAAAQWLSAHAGQARFNECDALALFATLGVAVPKLAILRTPQDAASARTGFEFPVAAKILSGDIAHKSDAGGVALNIASAEQLASAAADIMRKVSAAQPGARLDGVLVQEQATGVGEAIVGFRHDPLVGPVIVVGAGGVMAEIYRDIAIRPAPVDEIEARDMIGEVKGFSAMRGFRGRPEGDLDALARIVAAVSRLAFAIPAIAEAEINPVIVRRRGDGVIAVDGLLVMAQTPE